MHIQRCAEGRALWLWDDAHTWVTEVKKGARVARVQRSRVCVGHRTHERRPLQGCKGVVRRAGSFPTLAGQSASSNLQCMRLAQDFALPHACSAGRKRHTVTLYRLYTGTLYAVYTLFYTLFLFDSLKFSFLKLSNLASEVHSERAEGLSGDRATTIAHACSAGCMKRLA